MSDQQVSGLARVYQNIQLNKIRRWKGLDCNTIKPAGQKIPIQPPSPVSQDHQRLLKDIITRNLIRFSPIKQHNLINDNSFNTRIKTLKSDLTYKTMRTEGKLVRSTLEKHGFQQTDYSNWNILWIGASPPRQIYEQMGKWQKINHFPFSNEITRKDKLCNTIGRMMQQYGIFEFDYLPETYVLPDQYSEFFMAYKNDEDDIWIVKPRGLSRGRGIHVVSSIQEIPILENVVVSRYIQDPFLINGLKFDLRIYVAVTCFCPLKIYVYSEGLGRFSTEKYSVHDLKNRFMHLTNYSVNKDSDKFVQNTDESKDDFGSKWSLSATFQYLAKLGINTNQVWTEIYDIFIKTIISIENQVLSGIKKLNLSKRNCFELFGFDIILDQSLKPWLLEVNLSPSLATDSPLDLRIKSSLISDLFNMVGIEQDQINRGRVKKIQSWDTLPLKSKLQLYMQSDQFQQIFQDTLIEYQNKGNFIRIYPCQGCQIYDKFFKQKRLANTALYNALFQGNTSTNDSPIISQPSSPGINEPEEKIVKPSSQSTKQRIRNTYKSRTSSLMMGSLRRETIKILRQHNFRTSSISKRKIFKRANESQQSIQPSNDTVKTENLSQCANDLQQRAMKIMTQVEKFKQQKLQIQQSPSGDLRYNAKKTLPPKFPESQSKSRIITITRMSNLDKRCKECKQTIQGNSCQFCITNIIFQNTALTYEDLSVEYTKRIALALKSITELQIKLSWRKAINDFLYDPMWYKETKQLNLNDKLWVKLQSKVEQLESMRNQSNEEVEQITQQMTALQLENQLKGNKGKSSRPINHLISDRSGVLSEIISWLANLNVSTSSPVHSKSSSRRKTRLKSPATLK